ncbi:MAG: helix-turn-helix transcriptional regulator [Schwartzia sp.]|nr:helix-turn-helix transcriptional regulator [Schwartzia sp. (in: firmicutes)]MBQ3864139.1 helix-turn-helix transcriptional regulator [Schwartzia sp. (in: firmicutes)]
MSQRELANTLGVSNTRISNWEQGVNRPDAEMIGALCHALNVSPSRLLGIRISDRELTDKENDIIDAYRQKPEMQHAVDVLLGLAEDK